MILLQPLPGNKLGRSWWWWKRKGSRGGDQKLYVHNPCRVLGEEKTLVSTSLLIKHNYKKEVTTNHRWNSSCEGEYKMSAKLSKAKLAWSHWRWRCCGWPVITAEWYQSVDIGSLLFCSRLMKNMRILHCGRAKRTMACLSQDLKLSFYALDRSDPISTLIISSFFGNLGGNMKIYFLYAPTHTHASLLC